MNTSTQQAAEALAIAIARFRLADRDAGLAVTRVELTLTTVRTRYQIQH